MKVETFPLKDGRQGTKWTPEEGDEVISKRESIGKRENEITRELKNGKRISQKIPNYFLEVEHNGEIKTISMTGGQVKAIETQAKKAEIKDLTGKHIKFVSYEHETYGKQLGARLLKDHPKATSN